MRRRAPDPLAGADVTGGAVGVELTRGVAEVIDDATKVFEVGAPNAVRTPGAIAVPCAITENLFALVDRSPRRSEIGIPRWERAGQRLSAVHEPAVASFEVRREFRRIETLADARHAGAAGITDTAAISGAAVATVGHSGCSGYSGYSGCSRRSGRSGPTLAAARSRASSGLASLRRTAARTVARVGCAAGATPAR